jgi:imidazoleglycerol phosphate dehydratase HisB
MNDEYTQRRVTVERRTRETAIEVTLDLDGTGETDISTGIGFLDHLFDALFRHARMDVTLRCQGDLEIDDHHTAEDCALVLGQAIDQALGDRRGIERFASAYAPLDEALARVVIDLSGRPYAAVDMGLKRDQIGALATENIPHLFRSLSVTMRAAIHVDVLRGDNDHHRAEAACKACALALRSAVRRDGSMTVPSTKGVL